LKIKHHLKRRTPGLIVLFGSGEMSPTGRQIHETVLHMAGFGAPLRIGILETPTGFEVNAIHSWPERMENFFTKSLKNYKPQVTRIRAWRKDGPFSTNKDYIVYAVLNQDYLYCGAGSPGYAIRHLSGSRAYANLISAQATGAVLCLGSACAVAVSELALPVYEIFKAGEDLHWLPGLDLFSQYQMHLAIIPHWNNREGEDFDTTRCWMGQARFGRLSKMLPDYIVIFGIDEQTAAIFDPGKKSITVCGKGSLHIIRQRRDIVYRADQVIPFGYLTNV